jgi:hypothetical protein
MRMSMKKIREVLCLMHELGLWVRQVREARGVGKTAVFRLREPRQGKPLDEPLSTNRRYRETANCATIVIDRDTKKLWSSAQKPPPKSGFVRFADFSSACTALWW